MGDSYFPVSVKESNGRNNYMIQVGTKWSVAHVKRAVLEQSGLQPNQFKLVFAGMELKDNMTLEVGTTPFLNFGGGDFSLFSLMQQPQRLKYFTDQL